MKWIGLTGGMGTGKSTVSRILRDKGIPVLDADAMAKRAVEKGTDCLKSIIETFGMGVLDTRGDLDRKALAQQVFSDQGKLQALESIVHPKVQQLVANDRAELVKKGTALAFYDVPLLFEKNLQTNFDATVVVVCDLDTQIGRIQKRDGISKEEILLRIRNQMPLSDKRLLADYIIDNSGDTDMLKIEVDRFLSKILIYQPQE